MVAERERDDGRMVGVVMVVVEGAVVTAGVKKLEERKWRWHQQQQQHQKGQTTTMNEHYGFNNSGRGVLDVTMRTTDAFGQRS